MPWFSSRKEIMAEPTIRETGFVGAYDDVCATRINDLFRQSAFVLSFLSMIMCVDKTSVSICWYYGVVMYGKLKRDQ